MWTGEAATTAGGARVVVGRLEENAKEEDQVSEMAEKTREERERGERR